MLFFFFSSRRRHTRWTGDWSSDVCSSDLGLLGNRLAAVLGALVEVQLPDDLQGEQVALQDASLSVEIGLVIVVHDRHGILEGDEIRVRLVDGDATDSLVHRGLAEAGDGDRGENAHHAGDYDPLALEEDAQVFAQGRLLGGQHGIKPGANRLDEFSWLGRLDIAKHFVVWNQGPQCHCYSLKSTTEHSGTL